MAKKSVIPVSDATASIESNTVESVEIPEIAEAVEWIVSDETDIQTKAAVETKPAAVKAEPTVAVEAKPSFQKFAADADDKKANRYNIRNTRGELVTMEYLNRYVQCWCRIGDGFNNDRKANFVYFSSHEFLKQHVGETASAVGRAAAADLRWSKNRKSAAPAAAPVAAETLVVPDAPATPAVMTPEEEIADLQAKAAALDPADPAAMDALLAIAERIEVLSK